MPTYEYRCDKCGAPFEAQQTLAEHDNGWPDCPKCHSPDGVELSPSRFAARTSKKS